MPPINPASLESKKQDAIPVANAGSLEGFIKYMGILASSSESQFAATVIDEISQQREQIQSQKEELKQNQITINGMFNFNQDEKAKQKDSATQIELLRATVNEKETKIAEYSKSLEIQREEIAELKSARSKEEARVSQSAKDISTLQANLKERDKIINQMKTAGSKLKSALSSEKGKNEELEAANVSIRAELQAVRARMQKLEDFAVQPSDLDEDFVAAGFTSLWTSATSELNPLLEQDISEMVLKEKVIWERLRKVDNIILPLSFPLVPSNSAAAKSMRFALILAVIFREINQQIFQPSYFLSESNKLREALEGLADGNGEKEEYCRRILVSLDPDAERDALQDKIQSVVQKILSHAGGLFTGAQYDLFCSKIKTIVQNAAELWLPVQRSQLKFETNLEPFGTEHNDWDPVFFAGEDRVPLAQDLQGIFMLNIFPCVSLVEDGGHDPLTKVIQLRSSQEMYLAAHHEATQIVNPTGSKRYSTRARRQSTASSNGKPFLGGNSAKC